MLEIKKFVSDRKALLIAGLFVIIIFIALYSRLKNETASLPPTQNQNAAVLPSLPPLTQAAQLNEAVTDQQSADKNYVSWQETSRTDYPWINKLPLYSDKYFVYFDLEKKVFIGKLYPQIQDNVDELKSEIENRLKTDLEVPLENYIVNWNILPQ